MMQAEMPSTLEQVTMTAKPGWLTRSHEQIQASFIARLYAFIVFSILFFAMYLALNWPHLGINARLHWDAETSICTTDAMPNAKKLAENRLHIFDIANEIHSTDPATVTAYFGSAKGSGEHGPLETVRRYYSQISFFFARQPFAWGKKWFGTPVGAVVCFQLAAMLMVAVSMGMLLTFSIAITPAGPGLRVRLGVLLLSFTAIATQIIFLSIARQMLTETVGWFFWIVSMLLLVSAIYPGRALWVCALLAMATGASLFVTIRTRYNLGPAIALVIPLVLLVSQPIAQFQQHWKRYTLLALMMCSMFGALVAIDCKIYGPYFMPWVYGETLVRSTSLYFHSNPPYALFSIMLYNNFPLLLIPLLGVVASFTATTVRIYSAIAFCILTGLIILMAQQAVAYQGRHLFALSAAAVWILFLSIGRVQWKTISAIFFSTLCTLVILLNLHSTFGPQRLIPGDPGRPIIRQTFGQRWDGRKDKLSLLVDLINGYFEWSDDCRLHDPLIALQYLQQNQTHTRPLVVVTGYIQSAHWFWALAKQFNIADIIRPNESNTLPRIKTALAARQMVYLYAPTNKKNTAQVFDAEPIKLNFDYIVLSRITAVK